MHTALRRKSKDWLAQNQDNVVVWQHVLEDYCFSALALCKNQTTITHSLHLRVNTTINMHYEKTV